MGWYVAYTKPKCETVAQDNLLRQGFLVQLPRVRKASRRGVILEPLFPRYLFFALSKTQQSLSPVRSTVGVSSIVCFGTELAVLSNQNCESIMAYASAQQGGGIESMLEVQGVRLNQRVVIRSGPFIGMEGLASRFAKDRVIVLAKLLGKEQMLSFEPSEVSAA
jgi:transcriptional antiterminator RfaH